MAAYRVWTFLAGWQIAGLFLRDAYRHIVALSARFSKRYEDTDADTLPEEQAQRRNEKVVEHIKYRHHNEDIEENDPAPDSGYRRRSEPREKTWNRRLVTASRQHPTTEKSLHHGMLHRLPKRGGFRILSAVAAASCRRESSTRHGICQTVHMAGTR